MVNNYSSHTLIWKNEKSYWPEWETNPWPFDYHSDEPMTLGLLLRCRTDWAIRASWSCWWSILSWVAMTNLLPWIAYFLIGRPLTLGSWVCFSPQSIRCFILSNECAWWTIIYYNDMFLLTVWNSQIAHVFCGTYFISLNELDPIEIIFWKWFMDDITS